MEQQPAVDFVKAVRAFGGYTGLSRRLNVPLTTVHGWHRRNKLPSWRANQIAALALAEDIDVFTKRRRKVRQAPRRKRVT